MAVWKPIGVDIDLITVWNILFLKNKALLVGTERIVHNTYFYYKGELWLRSKLVNIKSEFIATQGFNLKQNYPNPFNPSTTIEFDLPKSSEVSLKIFNILGEEVATLVSGRLFAGSYSYNWNASNHASGVYLYRLRVGDFIETKKMILR